MTKMTKTRSIVCGGLFLAAFVSTVACGSSEPEEEAVGETTDGLVTGSPTGNVRITPDELKDPTTGCFVLNPICSLGSAPSGAATRDSAILDSDVCLRRSAEISLWCGNRQGVQTTAIFKVHNMTLRSSAYIAPNDSRCVISLGTCQRYPNLRGTFGDSFDGSDTNPTRCAARAKDFHQWCGNSPLGRVSARFDHAGVPGPTTFFP